MDPDFADTTYERGVVRQIAAWKAQPGARWGTFLNRLSNPIGRGLSRLLPESAINAAIATAYSTAQWLASPECREPPLGTALRKKQEISLERCDALAARVRRTAEAAAMIGGALTGMVGVLFAPIDVGALTVISLNAIQQMGHCYGFSLDQPTDRPYVLAILTLAGTVDLRERNELLGHLEDFRGWVFARTLESMAVERLTRQFVRIAAMESVPGVGILIGSAVNVLFVRRALTDCQRVFQQRWLREKSLGASPRA